MAKRSSSKKFDIRHLAWIGLLISGVALLAAVLGLVIKLLVYMKFFTLSNSKPLDLALWISLGLVIVGPALYALLDPQKVRDFLTGRQARHGSNALITLIAFLGIFVVINVLAYKNPHQLDWTSNKAHTLAPETIKILDTLTEPVKAYGFFTVNTPSTSAEQLLTDFKNKSGGKFDFQMVDPNNNPGLATQYNVNTDGSVVLTQGNNKELITTVSEQELDNALIRLLNPEQRTVYFLTGHGERDIENSSTESFTQLRSVLESKNYTAKTLNLPAEHAIPADALAIIIAGPTMSIPPEEMILLEEYVTNGGSLVVLEQPSVVNGAVSSASDPLLAYLETTWGITVQDDIIIDTNTNTSQLLFAFAASYGQHAITQNIQTKSTFYPMACSLSIKTVNTASVTDLVQTNSNTWGETDFAAYQSGKVKFDDGKDLPGPLTIAAAASASSGKGRVVVFGNVDFASNKYYSQAANGEIMINAIDWAAAQPDKTIGLTPKAQIDRTLPPPGTLALVFMGLSFICLIPGLIVAGGVTSWLLRRRRG